MAVVYGPPPPHGGATNIRRFLKRKRYQLGLVLALLVIYVLAAYRDKPDDTLISSEQPFLFGVSFSSIAGLRISRPELIVSNASGRDLHVYATISVRPLNRPGLREVKGDPVRGLGVFYIYVPEDATINRAGFCTNVILSSREFESRANCADEMKNVANAREAYSLLEGPAYGGGICPKACVVPVGRDAPYKVVMIPIGAHFVTKNIDIAFTVPSSRFVRKVRAGEYQFLISAPLLRRTPYQRPISPDGRPLPPESWADAIRNRYKANRLSGLDQSVEDLTVRFFLKDTPNLNSEDLTDDSLYEEPPYKVVLTSEFEIQSNYLFPAATEQYAGGVVWKGLGWPNTWEIRGRFLDNDARFWQSRVGDILALLIGALLGLLLDRTVE